MRVIPLGINGYIPANGRQTTSILVLTDVEAILLDAGTGIGRLLEEPIARLLRPYSRLNILLSHYHYDHIIGLTFLPEIWSREKIDIYVPGEPYVLGSPQVHLERLLVSPYFGLSLNRFPARVEVVN